MADTWTWHEQPDLKEKIREVRINTILKEWVKESSSVRNWLYASLVSASTCQKWLDLEIPLPDHIKAKIADEDHSGKIYFVRDGKQIRVMI